MARASDPFIRKHFRLSPRAIQTLGYFLVLAILILLVVLLIIVFKGMRAAGGI